MKSLATFASVAMRDRRGSRAAPLSHEAHLLAAEAWLCRAHDASADGGVSYGYTFRHGWRESYPETSGYIAPTFLRLAQVRDPSYLDRAVRILGWLLTVQNADGSFSNRRFGRGGIVFDTGQVLFGLTCGYQVTGNPAFQAAARKAAAWLTRIADTDGRWTRHEHLDTPHVYNTRTAWALLCFNTLEPDADRERVARSNLDWAVREQRASGFFDHCSFRAGEAPFSHTVAYTARGLLESGQLLGEARYLDAAERCADAMLRLMDDEGQLPSAVSVDGRPASGSCCLTGNCQFAIVWLRLGGLAGKPGYKAAALRALSYVMSTQDLATTDADIRGGIKGSHPVWGRYAPMSYPNWAAKFFVDAMWLAREAEE